MRFPFTMIYTLMKKKKHKKKLHPDRVNSAALGGKLIGFSQVKQTVDPTSKHDTITLALISS